MNWLRRWGPDSFLVVLAAAVVVSVLVGGLGHGPVAALLSAVAVLCFLARGVAPFTVTMAAFGVLAIGMSIEPHATTVQFVSMLVIYVCAGAVNRGRGLVVTSACGIALLGYLTMGLSTGAGWSDFALSSCIALGFMLAGWQVSRRTHEVVATRLEAQRAATLHAVRTREALTEERARIARELHDVVSHGLTVVVVQTQAARGALEDIGPDGSPVRRHLDAVEITAREALGEMRRMLGLLQLDTETSVGPEPPSPGLADLDALIDRARSAGIVVAADLPTELAQVRLGAGVALVVYRVAQESLTNVIKHAPAAGVDVSLQIGLDQIELVVRNPVAGPTIHGAPDSGLRGHGLIGMRERAITYGGRCTAGRVDGNFEVRLVLPLDRESSHVGEGVR